VVAAAPPHPRKKIALSHPRSTRKPERFHSHFVDHETEAGWLLEWQIGGVRAF
jgi:hypothetical protein